MLKNRRLTCDVLLSKVQEILLKFKIWELWLSRVTGCLNLKHHGVFLCHPVESFDANTTYRPVVLILSIIRNTETFTMLSLLQSLKLMYKSAPDGSKDSGSHQPLSLACWANCTVQTTCTQPNNMQKWHDSLVIFSSLKQLKPTQLCFSLFSTLGNQRLENLLYKGPCDILFIAKFVWSEHW